MNDMKFITINKNRGWRGLAEVDILNEEHDLTTKHIFSFSQAMWDDMIYNHKIVIASKTYYYVIFFDNEDRLPRKDQQRSVLIKNFMANITKVNKYSKEKWQGAPAEDWSSIRYFIKNNNNHTTSDWNCIRNSCNSVYIKNKRGVKMEIWKDIKGYEGKYQISSLGRVKSLKYNNTKESKLLHQSLINNYYSVCLWKQRKGKQYRIHRLVAEAFIPNPLHLPEVNHIDENKLNNNVDNLEWCSSKYNCNYGARNKKLSKPVQCVETGIIYPSILNAGKQTGINYTHLGDVARGKRKTAGGYHWKYVKEI